MDKSTFPFLADYAKFYVSYVKEDNLLDALVNNKATMFTFLKSIPADKMNFCYAIGKWTIKEVLMHIVDTERIMACRALSIARGETQLLPGFDENMYVAKSFANDRKTESFFEEYLTVRDATMSLFKYMDVDAMKIIGTANNRQFSPLSLGYIIAGHELHHIKVIKERYLI
jgi:hypothetical protein